MLQTVWIRGEGINPRQFCSKSPIDGGCDLGGVCPGGFRPTLSQKGGL